MFPSVIAKLHCLLVSSDNFKRPYAFSRSTFDIYNGLFCTLVFSAEISFCNSKIGMCELVFKQLSFNFSEANKIFLFYLFLKFLLTEI